MEHHLKLQGQIDALSLKHRSNTYPKPVSYEFDQKVYTTGCERRHEYRLWFLTIDKWNKDASKKFSVLWAFQNMVFFLSLKLTEIFEQFCWFLISWNLGEFSNFSVNFESEKMVDHILEIPRLLVFCIKCFSCNTTQLCLQNISTWIKDDTWAAVVRLNIRAGSPFPVPVCTVPSSMDKTSRCNKVDAVRLYASHRLNLLLLKGQRCVYHIWVNIFLP